MSLTSVAVLVIVLLLAAYAVILYNALVRLKHGLSKAWANIDVLLKQRHEELPKLVETCKQYMQYEGRTLERVIPRAMPSPVPASSMISAPWARRKVACVSALGSCSPWPRTTRS